MSKPAPQPGAPPEPPADLVRRALPIHTVPAATSLYRIHWSHLEPLYFGRSTDPGERNRWDAPDARYGVCYLGETSTVAFAETYLRERVRLIEENQLAPKSLAALRTDRDLRLVQMHGAGLTKLGADASVVAGPYPLCQKWSAALHQHPGTPDGIRYRARHDDDGFAIALFDRAADALVEVTRYPLVAAESAQDLASWLDRYGLGLI